MLVGAVVIALLVPASAAADTETIQDTTAFDVPHRDIDMKSLTVTYNSKGAVAKLRFKELRKQKRLRLFVQFFNRPNDDIFAPTYGNFLELRINEKRKIRRVNWVIDPDDEFDGYHAEKCRGIKVKVDFDKDLITYKLRTAAPGSSTAAATSSATPRPGSSRPSTGTTATPRSPPGTGSTRRRTCASNADGGMSEARIGFRTGMTLQGTYEPSTAAWVRKQVEEYESSNGERANILRGRPDWPIVVITSVGHKSGRLRKNPVMRVEHDGVYAAIASYGGSPEHPEWFHNFVANPRVDLQDGAEPEEYVARIAEGEERAEWWERAVRQFSPYADYQERTDREIPVFLLERA